MQTLLTTRDVQEMINVDKSTIYRMAEDGRLPAVKVGRQWRFPASAVASLLGEGATALTRQSPADAQPVTDLLPRDIAQATVDLLGDLFGSMAVITTMDGTPLTSVANPCGFYDVIATAPNAVEYCLSSWQALSASPDLEPKFIASDLGFLCTRSFVRQGDRLVAMAAIGGITAETGPPDADSIERLAAELGVPAEHLAARAHEMYDLSPDERRRLLRLLPRFTDVISRFISNRNDPVAPELIAALAGATTENS